MKAEFPKYNNVKHETLYTAKFYVVKGGSPQVDLHPYPRAGRALKTEATGTHSTRLLQLWHNQDLLRPTVHLCKSTSANRDDSATEESQSIKTALINDQSQSHHSN